MFFGSVSFSPAILVPLQIQPAGHFDLSYVLSNGLSAGTQVEVTGDLTIDLGFTRDTVTSLRKWII